MILHVRKIQTSKMLTERKPRGNVPLGFKKMEKKKRGLFQINILLRKIDVTDNSSTAREPDKTYSTTTFSNPEEMLSTLTPSIIWGSLLLLIKITRTN